MALLGKIVLKDGAICLEIADEKKNVWWPLNGNSGVAIRFVENFGPATAEDIGKTLWNTASGFYMNPPEKKAPDNAQHIFNWCRNSQEHHAAMVAARAYPEGESFSPIRANGVFTVAKNTYREMKPDRQGESYSAAEILAAAILMLEWDGEE